MPSNLQQYLWDIVTAFTPGQGANPWPRGEAPPVALEEALNGGPSSHIAHHYARLMAQHARLQPAPRVLDWGCGYGRLAVQLLGELGSACRYIGIDPHQEAIDWARVHVKGQWPHAVFERLDIHSQVYNPNGQLKGAELTWPFADGSLDMVVMMSVMTHVDWATACQYVREAGRVLNPRTGRFMATFFLLDSEVDALIAAGRSDFSLGSQQGRSRFENPQAPEAAIAHPRADVLAALHQAGFGHMAVKGGSWCGRDGAAALEYQDLVVADRAPIDPASLVPVPGAHAEVASALMADNVRLLASVGIHSERETSAFLDWAMPVTLHALWWTRNGGRLVIIDPLDPHRDAPAAWVLTRCQRCGLDAHAPPETVMGDRFVRIGETEFLDMLAAADPVATVDDVLHCLSEMVRNGVQVLQSQRAGRGLELVAPEGQRRQAPVPAFQSDGRSA